MIKLEFEIKNDEVHWSYFVGDGNSHGSAPLSADALVAFNDLLRICAGMNKWRAKEFERDLWGKCYLEKLEKEKNK
jgi:hypothetical protein